MLSIKRSLINRGLSYLKKREYLTIALLLIIIISISFFNILFLGKTLSASAFSAGVMPSGPYDYIGKTFSDQPVIDPWASALQYEPELYLTSIIYKSWNFPLWNPYIATGVPLAGDMISSVFFPINFVAYIAPIQFIWSAIDFILLLRLFLAGFFTYCFMREIRLSKTGSFVSACAFMLNGYLILYINMSHLNVEVLIPALLYFIERLFKNQNMIYCIYSSLFIALSIIGGMPESAFFSFFFVGLYYLFRVYKEYRLNWQRTSRSLSWLFIAFILGVLLSSFVTIPFIEYLRHSWNFHVESLGTYHYRFSFDTISLVVRYFFGSIKGIWNGTEVYEILPYIGIMPLFFAFAAVPNGNKSMPSVITFFSGFSFFYILKTYGFPVINLIGLLPLFNVSIFPKYCFPEFALSIAILAGIGFDNILRFSFKRLLLQSTLITSLIIVFAFGSRASHHVSQILLTVGSLAQALSIIFLLIGALYLYHKQVINLNNINKLLVIVLIFELVMYIPHERAERVNPFEPAPYINFINQDHDTFRVIGLNNVLMPNVACAFGIFDVRELFPMKIDLYRDFIYYTVDPFSKRFLASDLQISPEKIKILSFLNVKYILSTHYLSLQGLRNGTIMAKKILKDGQIVTGNKELIKMSTFDGKDVLFQHPPSKINYKLFVPKGPVALNFSISLSPQVWSPDKGDGVLFEITAEDSKIKSKIFSKYIDPKNNATDRKFFQEEVDMADYSGRNITLSFITSPGKSNLYDWAGWGDIYLKTSDTEKNYFNLENKLKLVYDNEIKIYKNEDFLPRSFIIQDAELENSEQELFNKIASGKFDFGSTAVLNRLPVKTYNPSNEDSSVIKSQSKIITYETNEIKLSANTTIPGYLITSEVYYPGWKVYVDGKEKDVLIVNHAFRAVLLEKGNHIVQFIYDPISFKVGSWISAFTFLFMLCYLLRNRFLSLVDKG